jgi:hypothetical protein
MKRLTARILTLSAAVLLFGAGLAHADFTNWEYSWSISPGPVIKPSPDATGSVLFALDAGGPGADVIRAANVTTNSSAENNSPDVFGNVGYTLTLNLKDDSDGSTGSLDFNAKINGNLTSTGSTLTNTFTAPLTQDLNLPNHTFSVTIDPTTASLPGPGLAVSALLDAFVNVSDPSAGNPPAGNQGGGGGGGGAGPVASAPEPTSLFLGGLGFSALGLGCWWKRKRQGGQARG